VLVRRSSRAIDRLPRSERRRQDNRDASGVRLVELDSGSVRWHSAPIKPEHRHRFGYMPEERGLYPRMRVRDQLVYFGMLCGSSQRDAGRSVDAWLDRLGLAPRAHDRLDALSHGNQQRVQLIAALVNEPDLLVLDEPFSGLDPLAMTAMSELLEEAAGHGTTVVFSSHQLDLVEHICEDVVIVNAGRIVLAGDLNQLRAGMPRRIVTVRYRGSAPDWTRLPGATELDSAPGEGRLLVDQQTDLQSLVAATRGVELTSFAYEPPTLSELFRQAVAA
jgi:ABC-2 type transport system ATP-binding protein